jgi:DNA-cytosine methyltransferase
MKMLDLFSGIGGFSLAGGWAGFETVAFFETDPFCRKILKKHWPDVLKYMDIRDVSNPGHVDLITGGLPCQPFSIAGKRKGKDDARYLWPEFLRIISISKPTWVIAENVTGIVEMELDNILSDLEAENYKTQSFIIPACAANAPHRRDRDGLLPTVLTSDATCGQILGKKDTYRLTKNGTLRRYNQNGKNSSLSLGRLIRLKTGLKLTPDLAERMMGYERGWTNIE